MISELLLENVVYIASANTAIVVCIIQLYLHNQFMCIHILITWSMAFIAFTASVNVIGCKQFLWNRTQIIAYVNIHVQYNLHNIWKPPQSWWTGWQTFFFGWNVNQRDLKTLVLMDRWDLHRVDHYNKFYYNFVFSQVII